MIFVLPERPETAYTTYGVSIAALGVYERGPSMRQHKQAHGQYSILESHTLTDSPRGTE